MEPGDKRWSRQVLIAGLAIGLLLLVGLLFAHALTFVLLILAGALLAIALVKATRLLAHWTRLPYRYAYAVVLVLTILATGGMIYLVGDSVVQHGQKLVEQIGSSSDEFIARLRQHSWGRSLLKQFPSLREVAIEGAAEGLSNRPGGDGQSGGSSTSSNSGPPAIVRGAMRSQGLLPMIGTFFSVTASTLGGLILVTFLAIYFALDPDLYTHGLAKLMPIDRRKRLLEVLRLLGDTLWWWILGRLLAMVIIGTLSTLGLWMIGIPMALPLGVLAGLLNFIPNIGPTLALMPPLLFGLQQGATTAIYVFAWYMVLQFVETYLITPIIEQRQVSLPPGVTIPVQALFGLTAGVFGLLMATPLAAVVMVLVREYYVKDWLGDAECDDPHALMEKGSREARDGGDGQQRSKTGGSQADKGSQKVEGRT